MRFHNWLYVTALLLAASSAQAVYIKPGDYLFLLEKAKAYGYAPVYIALQIAPTAEENSARQAALLAELGTDTLSVGQQSTIAGGFASFLNLYLNEAGVRKLIRSAYVKEFSLTDDGSQARKDDVGELWDQIACAGSADLEMTIKLRNLSFSLDAAGNTVYSSSPVLDEEQRSVIPAFVATLPAAGGTWLNPPTTGADGLPHFEPTLKFRVNQTGLVALLRHAEAQWVAPLARSREPIDIDPDLASLVESTDPIPIAIAMRLPDGYGYGMPQPSNQISMASLDAAAWDVVAAQGWSQEAIRYVLMGTITANVTGEQLRRLLAAPDPRIRYIVLDRPIVVLMEESFAPRREKPRRQRTTSASCPPVVEYPAPETQLCLRETELGGDATTQTLLHYLHVDYKYVASVPGSIFVGATDSAQPGRLWLMDALGAWHEYHSGEQPAVYSNQLNSLTGIAILSVPTDLRGLEGRVSFWAGFGWSITKVRSYDPADHFWTMQFSRSFHKVWTVGENNESQGEVCAAVSEHIPIEHP